MAKIKLSKLLPSLESEDGVAHSVDVKEESAELGKAEVQQVADDGSGKGDVAEAAFEVEVDGKDFTAIDEASKRQGEAIHKQFERLQETECSLEAYIGVLRGAKATRSSIGSGAAAVIKFDLEARYPKFFTGLIPSVEAYDGDKSLVVSEQLESNLGSKLKGVGKAIGAALKKFWEWVKGIYAKAKVFIKKLIDAVMGEKQKTIYLLKVEKSITTPGGKPKALPAPPAGVKSRAANAVQLLLADHSKSDKPPAKKRTLPETVKVTGVSILESVENDPWGIGRYESTILNHIYEMWIPVAERAITKLESTADIYKSGSGLDKQIEEIASAQKAWPATSVMGGNYVVTREGDSYKIVMSQKDGSGKSLEELRLESQADIRDHLDRNEVLLSNIERTSAKWEKIQEKINKLESKFDNELKVTPEAKNALTKYVTQILSSDIDRILKHAGAVAAKRNDVLDYMLMIHAQGGVEDSK